MSRKRKGSIVKKDGKLYARIRFVDDNGKNRDLWRVASNKKEAKEKIKQLIEESTSRTSEELDALKMTFNHLADFYEENYLHEAIYVNERKISGIRNINPYKYHLKNLRFHFGKQLVQSISYINLAKFKLKRLKTPTKLGKQRSITDVNRQLQLLRRILNIAVRQGWIPKNPFHNGDSLISLADENQRTRILSFEEEIRLLAVIESNPLLFNLKGIVLIALDCALRKNEIITLCKKDLDLINKTITVRAFNSKTSKSRTVGITSRVHKWLSQYSNFKDDERIFPVKNVDTSWRKSLKKAKIDDFHFHDCRATCISRLISLGIPHTEVMRISGHQTISCLFRYIRADSSTIVRAANALDNFLLTQHQNYQENQSELVN